ncbi:hypothetical protein F5877DRAFT_72877 [Lentinula edodes]|nr:hypothetical protein F5877DRAFT_72877 [Lentinula edodes]
MAHFWTLSETNHITQTLVASVGSITYFLLVKNVRAVFGYRQTLSTRTLGLLASRWTTERSRPAQVGKSGEYNQEAPSAQGKKPKENLGRGKGKEKRERRNRLGYKKCFCKAKEFIDIGGGDKTNRQPSSRRLI